MLACLGYITPEFVKFPGYLSPSTGLKFADVPTGLAATTKVPAVGWTQYVVFCGICELFLLHQDPDKPPGKLGTRFFGEGNTNYEYGSLGIPNYLGGAPIADLEIKKTKLNAELANGRLAMMAIIGMFFQDGLTGSAWGDWANYTSSPMRAFEGELGIQAPVGFWDPLGLSADGDVAFFKRRRETELKHGRISMFACIGYIVPEYFRFPGELSPKLGLQFTDIPNGLAAISKVPGQGWSQIVGFLGTYELFINTPVGDEPGNYGKGNLGLGFLGPVSDPEARKKKLSAELANGRLAMVAIIGMFFQDGLTGSAWGDWALYVDSPLRAEAAASVPARSPQEVLAGTGGPFPENFWDPAGLSRGKTEQEMLELRAIELKHGRVSMLACLGWFHVAAGWHPVGDFYIGEYDVIDDNPLISLTQLPIGGIMQVVFTIMVLEWLTLYITKPPVERPWDLLGWTDVIADEEYPPWKERQLQELNNGRLAMMGIVGLIVGDSLFGEYFKGIGQVCFGNPVCEEIAVNFLKGDLLNGPPMPSNPYGLGGIFQPIYPPLYPPREVLENIFPGGSLG